MNEENSRQACGDCTAMGPQQLLASYAAAEDGIARRTFLVQSGILAALAALTACNAGSSSTAPNVPSGSSINVNNYPALANAGGVATVSFGGAPVAIVRTQINPASFLALSLICPHQGGNIQFLGSRFQCPVHGATFDVDGNWIGGQPTSNMHQYSTSFDASTNTLTVG